MTERFGSYCILLHTAISSSVVQEGRNAQDHLHVYTHTEMSHTDIHVQ